MVAQHCLCITWYLIVYFRLPCWLCGKESACNAGGAGLISKSGRSPGEGNGNPLQYSCLENSMDWGAWRGTVHYRESDTTKATWHTGRQLNTLKWLIPYSVNFTSIFFLSKLFLKRKSSRAFLQRWTSLSEGPRSTKPTYQKQGWRGSLLLHIKQRQKLTDFPQVDPSFNTGQLTGNNTNTELIPVRMRKRENVYLEFSKSSPAGLEIVYERLRTPQGKW